MRNGGYFNEDIVDKDFNIIAGHGRVEAAKAEHLTEVPCVFKKCILELKAREKLLKIELQEIQNKKIEIAYILGGGEL